MVYSEGFFELIEFPNTRCDLIDSLAVTLHRYCARLKHIGGLYENLYRVLSRKARCSI